MDVLNCLPNNLKLKKGDPWEKVITCGYLVAFIASLSAIFMTANYVAQWFLYQSDGLWIEDYLQDWLVRGVDMRTWMTPGAPNFFPEMLIYGLIRFATASVYFGFLGFAFVKILMFIIIIYCLLSLISDISRVHRLWFSLFCTSTILLTAIFLGQKFDHMRVTDFWQLLVPFAHGGAIVNGMIAILILFYWFRNPKRSIIWLLLLLVLSIGASLSDRLYMVWFALPAIGALIILVILGQVTWRVVCLFAGALVISDVIGRKIFSWLVPLQQVPYNFSFSEGLKATSHFYAGLLKEGLYFPLVLFVYFCLVVLTLWVLFQDWKVRNRESIAHANDANKAKLFLLSFAALVLPVSFFAMAAINRPEAQYFTGGNLLALSLLPFLLIMSSWGRRIWEHGLFHLISLLILLSYVIVLAVSSPLPLSALLKPADPYSTLVACLDSHATDLGNKVGIADYWQAREVNLFSKNGIRIDQAQGANLQIFQWVSDREMFDSQKHTFVITDTPTNLSMILDNDVIRINGQPDMRFNCNGYPILVYDKGVETSIPLTDRLNELSKGQINKVVLNKIDMLSDVGSWQGGILSSNGKAGWLQFGPYTTFPSGSYNIEWKGIVMDGGPDKIGKVDITSNLGVNGIAHMDISSESLSKLPKDQLAKLELTLDRDTPATEFRFYVNDKALVRIYEVVITRIDH